MLVIAYGDRTNRTVQAPRKSQASPTILLQEAGDCGSNWPLNETAGSLDNEAYDFSTLSWTSDRERSSRKGVGR